MAKITLTLFSDEEKHRIHTASLWLLEEVGLMVLDSEAVDILAGAGAKVDGKTKRVRFPADMVEEAVRHAPSEVRLYGRQTDRCVHLKPGCVFYTTNGYATNLYDPESGSRHLVDQKDLAYITQLADSLEQVDVYSVMATPNDTPPETNDRYQLAISLANSTKHIWNTAYGRDGVRDAVEMAAAVRGSREALRQYPLITLDLTTLSPLTLDERQAGTMIEGARHELPIGISPGPIAGATGPVTLAGTVVQANAELLGAITLCQTVRPGLPVIFTQYTRSLDMTTGGVTMGGPEFSLLRVATAEMSRYYGLPSRGGGMIADAKAADAQMGAEKMLNCLMASLAGLTIIAGVGQADFINTVRPDLMLIDNEIISLVRRILQGLDASPQSLALEVIAEVGPGGNYLAHDHTASHFRKELWIPRLWDRKTWSVWEQEGGKDVARRAADRLKTWKPSVPPLPTEAETAIWEVVHAADARPK